MNQSLDQSITSYLTAFLLRYFRQAKTAGMNVSRPDLDADRDLDLLRLHWAISKPVERLITHLRENPHEIATTLESRRCVDDARVRGRFDARETVLQQLLTAHPALLVSHEPLRSYHSGPNQVLTWVLEQAWRLSLRFHGLLREGATYYKEVAARAAGLETIRRFETVQRAIRQQNLSRRPGPQALKEAGRSRRRIYVLAAEAYRSLQAVENRDEAAIAELLKDTLLGPTKEWQRYELAVGLGLARALSKAHHGQILLGFFGSSEPIAQIGDYKIEWQPQNPVRPGRTEELVAKMLKEYGFSEGYDRPDLVVIDRRTEDVVAVVEVKYSSRDKKSAAPMLRAAVGQLARYAQGYRRPLEEEQLLDHSIAALSQSDRDRNPEPKPYGLPLVVDFDSIVSGRLDSWARRLVREQETAFAGELRQLA